MRLLQLFVFVPLLSACNNQPVSKKPAEKPIGLYYKDTVFLEREFCDEFNYDTSYHFYHAVFIDTNRNSQFYKKLYDFRFTKTENLDDYKKTFKDKKVVFPKPYKTGLPVEWVPLYQYKRKFYVYSPSEAGELNRRILNDSLLIAWYIDGPYPYVLDSARKVNEHTYSFTTREYFNNSDVFAKPEILNIYIVDDKTQMAVWEYKSRKDKQFFYRLFIPREHIKDFDLVVNYCLTDKQMEFHFEEPDFPSLLKKVNVK